MSHQSFNYKTEINRYNYYYRRLQVFYQKPSVQVSSAVLFAIGSIIFFAVFAIKPTLVTIAELQKKIADQRQVLQKAEKKASALATAQQQYYQIQSSLSTLDEAIPGDYQLQSLLLSIEALAASLNASIANLRLSQVEYPIPAAKSPAIGEISFNLSFTATYQDAKSVISQLNLLPRLIVIDSISIGQPSLTRQTQASSSEALEINLKCRTFFITPKEGI